MIVLAWMAAVCHDDGAVRERMGTGTELRADAQARDAVPGDSREQPRPAESAGPRAETMTRQEHAGYRRQGPVADVRGEYPAPGAGGQDDAGEAFGRLGERSQGMTREEYADYMRQLTAAEAGDQDHVPGPAAAEPPGARLGEHAQGMTREEYADYMRQLTAAGGDDPVGGGSLRARDGPIRDEQAQADTAAPATSDSPGDPVAERSGGSGRDAPADQQELAAPPGDRAGEQPTAGDANPASRPADVSPEAAQIAELRAQLAQARAELDQTKGELGETRSELGQTKAELDETRSKLDQANHTIAGLQARDQGEDAQSEHAEQPSTDLRQDASDAIRPERSLEEEAEGPLAQDGTLRGREETDEATKAKDARLTRGRISRHVFSADSLAIAGALADSYDAASKFAVHAMPDGFISAGAMLAGLTSVGISKVQERRRANKE
jgi:hypothetical protein